jgi:hypothetical protein
LFITLPGTSPLIENRGKKTLGNVRRNKTLGMTDFPGHYFIRAKIFYVCIQKQKEITQYTTAGRIIFILLRISIRRQTGIEYTTKKAKQKQKGSRRLEATGDSKIVGDTDAESSLAGSGVDLHVKLLPMP